MTKTPGWTPAMRRMLMNIAVGRSPTFGLIGRSAHGGATWTIAALVKRGYITAHGDFALTESGRKLHSALCSSQTIEAAE